MNSNYPQPYAEIESLARLMDDRFEIAGFRFGINFFIDLFPGVGDLIATALAVYIFSLASKYKLSAWTQFKMMLNIAVYFLVGLIPFLGDVLATWWKPNRRNVNLLRKSLEK